EVGLVDKSIVRVASRSAGRWPAGPPPARRRVPKTPASRWRSSRRAVGATMRAVSLRFIARSVIRTTPEQLFAFHELPDAFLRLLPPGEKIRVIQIAPDLNAGGRTIVKIRI